MGFLGISLAGLEHTKYYAELEPTMHWEAVPQNRTEPQTIHLSQADDNVVVAYLTHLCVRGLNADKFTVTSPAFGRGCTLESPFQLGTEPFPVVLEYDTSEIGTHSAFLEIFVEYDGEPADSRKVYLSGTTISPPAVQPGIEWISPHPPTGSPAIPEKLVSGTTYRVRWNASSDLVEFDLYARSESGKPGSFGWTKLNSQRLTTTYFDWYVYEKPEKLDCKFKVYGYETPGSQVHPVAEASVNWNLRFVRIICPTSVSSYGGEIHCNGTFLASEYHKLWYLTGYLPDPMVGYRWQISHDQVTWKPDPPAQGTGNPRIIDWKDYDLLYADDPTVWLRIGIYKAGPTLIDWADSETFTVTEGNQCN